MSEKKHYQVLEILIEKIDEIQEILESVKTTNHTYKTKEIIDVYDKIFGLPELKKHIEYKVSFVGKSTVSLYNKKYNKSNSNNHITLRLKSYPAIWFDNLYIEKFSDILKVFKFLFSTIENYAIYQNQKKLEKLKSIIGDIKLDLSSFLDAEVASIDNLRELKKIETQEQTLIQKGIKYKSNWQSYFKIITNNIENLYHFTDNKNLKSIIENGGLYSWKYAGQNGIKISNPGGNELSRRLDYRKGCENYVRLSFCEDHPMMFFAKKEGRIDTPYILKVKPEVIYHTGTKYCNMNATTSGAIISGDFTYFEEIDFSIFSKKYKTLDKSLKSYYQAEVLVYQHLPLAFITNLSAQPLN